VRTTPLTRWHVVAIALLAAAALVAWVGYGNRELALQFGDLRLCR
jgi:hypothetical protein